MQLKPFDSGAKGLQPGVKLEYVELGALRALRTVNGPTFYTHWIRLDEGEELDMEVVQKVIEMVEALHASD